MIVYEHAPELTVEEFIHILQLSGLASRRPVDQPARIGQMLTQADLIVTARDQEMGRLVGVARSLTDFSYCCYLSDLAVDRAYQRQGIGRGLVEHTSALAGPGCSVVLVSAPDAVEFYRRIGMPEAAGAFVYRRQV